MRKAFIIRPSQGGHGSVRWGIGLVANRLNVDASGIPGSFYLPHMENFKDAMIRYRWPEWDELSPPPSTPLKVDDDLVDADRYMHELLPKQIGAPEQFLSQIPIVVPAGTLTGNNTDGIAAAALGIPPKIKKADIFDASYILEDDFDSEIKIF